MKTVLAAASGFGLIAALPGFGWQGNVPVWAERLGWTLVHSSWALTLVGVAAAFVNRMLDRRTANARYVASVMAFALMIFVIGTIWISIDSSDDRTDMNQGVRENGAIAALIQANDVDHNGPAGSTSERASVLAGVRNDARRDSASSKATVLHGRPGSVGDASPKSSSISWRFTLNQFIEKRITLIVLFWIVGVALFACRPIWGIWTQWQLGRQGLSPIPEPIQRIFAELVQSLGLRRTVRIAQSICVRGPLLVGYLRPIILLPVSVLTTLTPPQLRALLAHELAHVRRHDFLVNAVQVAMETLLFFHPAVWWLSRRIREERENCCDDLAVSLGNDRATYAKMLLILEEMRQSIPQPALAATDGALVHRVRRLLSDRDTMERGPHSGLAASLLLVWLVVAAFMGSLRLITKSEAQQPKNSAKETTSDRLIGVVLRDDGSPAAGATITAAAAFFSPPRRITTTTDELGSFRIEIPRVKDDAFGSGNDIPYGLAVRWKTFGADIHEALDADGNPVPILGQKVQPLEIRLGPGGRLHGKLLQEEDDRPIPRAHLFMSTGEVLATNDEGKFEVNGFPLESHSLIAVAQGRARRFVVFDTTKQPDSQLEVKLPRGGIVKGRVSGEKGKPIRDSFVKYGRRSGNVLTLNGWDEACRADGSFRFDGIPLGDPDSAVSAGAPGYELQAFAVTVNTPGQIVEHDFTLKKVGAARTAKSTEAPPAPAGKRARQTRSQREGEESTVSGVDRNANGEPIADGAITGRVVDSNGVPVRKFQIKKTFPRPFSRDELVTEIGCYDNVVDFTRDDGIFVLGGFGANKWIRLVVTSSKIGFATMDRVKTRSREEAAKPEDLTITLKPFTPLTVRVEDAAGRPIAGAVTRIFDDPSYVNVRINWNGSLDMQAEAKTDARGDTHFANLECDTGMIAVSAPGFARARATWPKDARTVKVVLDPESVVEGDVRFKDQLVTKGTVYLMSNIEASSIDLAKSRGRYKFDRLPAGAYELMLSINDTGQQRKQYLASGAKQTINFKIPDSLDEELTDADRGVSETRPAGTKFLFQVITSNGQPVAGATVKLNLVSARNQTRFAVSPAHFPQDAKLFPSMTTDLNGRARIVLPDDSVLANARYDQDREEHIHKTLSQRELIFHLQVTHADHPPWQGPVADRSNGPIVLPESITVVIRAHLDDQPPLVRRIYPSQGGWRSPEFSEEDGVLTLRNVDVNGESGSNWLRVVHVGDSGPAWFSDVIDLRKEKGPIVQLDLSLKPGVRLTGRLAADAPRPIKNGRVVGAVSAAQGARNGWIWVAATEIAPDGTFVFESLPANDKLQLVAQCDGWISQSPTIGEVKAYLEQNPFDAGDYEGSMQGTFHRTYPRLYRSDASGAEINVPMGRTSTAEVLVVDENDKPLGNAHVGFSPNIYWYWDGGTLLTWGYDQMSLIRDRLASGKRNLDDEPWRRWQPGRYRATTNAEGIAIVDHLPSGSTANGNQPKEFRFRVTRDDYVNAAPPNDTRGDFRDTSTIHLVPGENGKVTVRMKRK